MMAAEEVWTEVVSLLLAAGAKIDLQNWVINPRRTCTAKVTVLGLCVCLSVCLSTRVRTLQATRWPMNDTRSFRATKT